MKTISIVCAVVLAGLAIMAAKTITDQSKALDDYQISMKKWTSEMEQRVAALEAAVKPSPPPVPAASPSN
jgi:hypothetical protein